MNWTKVIATKYNPHKTLATRHVIGANSIHFTFFHWDHTTQFSTHFNLVAITQHIKQLLYLKNSSCKVIIFVIIVHHPIAYLTHKLGSCECFTGQKLENKL